MSGATMSEASEVLVSRDGAIATLTINRPRAKNSLNRAVFDGLRAQLVQLRDDDTVRAVIITGAEGVFCAGADITAFDALRAEPLLGDRAAAGGHFWSELERFPKPVIAAVEGPAAGAGFSLVLACDLIVASSSAVFVMAYSNIALSPDGGGSWSLANAMPRQLATELLMCGEKVSVSRLQQLGIVNRSTEPGQALGAALELATSLNARAPNALASIKELLNQAPGASLNQALAQERDHFVANLHHANAGIGISAFIEKTPPRYS